MSFYSVFGYMADQGLMGPPGPPGQGFKLTSGGNYDVRAKNLENVGNIYPDADNTYELGSSSLRWADVNAMRVNIGTTSEGTYPLTLQGVAGGGNSNLLQYRNSAGTNKWHMTLIGGNNLSFTQTSVADNRLTLFDTGNVGINKTSASKMLDVNGTIQGTDLYADRLLVGTSRTSTSPAAEVHIQHLASCGMWIEADTNNLTETDNPHIRLTQDGNAVMTTYGIDDTNSTYFKSYYPDNVFKFYTGGTITGSADGVVPTTTAAPTLRMTVGTNVDVATNMTVLGDTTIGGDLSVVGNLSAPNLDIGENITVKKIILATDTTSLPTGTAGLHATNVQYRLVSPGRNWVFFNESGGSYTNCFEIKADKTGITTPGGTCTGTLRFLDTEPFSTHQIVGMRRYGGECRFQSLNTSTPFAFYQSTGVSSSNEVCRIDSTGINAPAITFASSSSQINVNGSTHTLPSNDNLDCNILTNTFNCGLYFDAARPAITTGSTINAYEIRANGSGGPNSDYGFMRIRAGGGFASGYAAYIDLSGYNTNSDMDRTIKMGIGSNERLRLDSTGVSVDGVRLKNLSTSGSFTWSGPWTSSQTIAYEMVRTGRIVQLKMNTGAFATTNNVSNAISVPDFTLPVDYRPNTNQYAVLHGMDNGVYEMLSAYITINGAIQINRQTLGNYTIGGNSGFRAFVISWMASA